MLPSFCADVVTVVRPAHVAQRGTVVPDWANAQRHSIRGCSVQLPHTSMSLDGRQQTDLRGTLYAPPTADIKAHDLAVVGAPMPWASPAGRVTHVQAAIEEWGG